MEGGGVRRFRNKNILIINVGVRVFSSQEKEQCVSPNGIFPLCQRSMLALAFPATS